MDGVVETFNAYMSHEAVQKSGLLEEMALIKGVMWDRRLGRTIDTVREYILLCTLPKMMGESQWDSIAEWPRVVTTPCLVSCMPLTRFDHAAGMCRMLLKRMGCVSACLGWRSTVPCPTASVVSSWLNPLTVRGLITL